MQSQQQNANQKQENSEMLHSYTLKEMEKRAEIFAVSKSDLITKREHFEINYELLQELGRGSFGQVLKAKHRVTGSLVAVKTIDKMKNFRYISAIEKELSILRQLDHPNIIKFFEWYDDMRKLYLVFEPCVGGELLEYVIKQGGLDESSAAMIFRQVLLAINYLHKRNLCHRDIKPDNVLLLFEKNPFPIKLIDFGLAVEFADEKFGRRRLTQVAGTPAFIAPEVLLKNYNEKCDLWSAGVLLYFIVTGVLPFNAPNDLMLYDLIKKAKYSFPDNKNLSGNCISLIQSLLIINPETRASAEEALQHPWLSNFPLCRSLIERQIKSIFHYNSLDKIQKIVLAYITARTSDIELMPALTLFLKLDSNYNGSLSKTELIKSEYSDISDTFSSLTLSKSEEISYLEFSSAFVIQNCSTEKINDAFEFFDKDRNGKICANDLRQVIGKTLDIPEEIFKDLYLKYDTDRDGMLNFSEFSQMVKKIYQFGNNLFEKGREQQFHNFYLWC